MAAIVTDKKTQIRNNHNVIVMIVCIAEKPSVGGDIAKVLGATQKHDGYYEGNGYQVTWTFGHLCCLKEPHDYESKWKWWSMDVLPMVPPRFGIKLIDDAGIKKQFGIVKKLFEHATEIINCGDAGQEGELIQRWVIQLSKVRCPVKRLWISSLTEESIKEGFKNLVDQSHYNNLYLAGLSRACGDWLLGINATRLYTLKYGMRKQVLSIGRVQTPTLALIVQRYKEIQNFKPEPYWILQTKYRNVTFTSLHGKYKSEDEGQKVLGEISDKPFFVSNVVKKQGSESPRQLYDLTALQVDCNKRFGFSADLTLKTIQSLYEKKLTTYPRVDTRYLSDDIYPKCQGIISGIIKANVLGQPMVDRVGELLPLKLPKSRKVFDSSKVTDHHAIIPTGVTPSELSSQEARVYVLIVRSFLSVFLPDCKYFTTVVNGRVEKEEFKVTGKEITHLGWRILYQNEVEEREEDEPSDSEQKNLPSFAIGEKGPHSPILQSKMTNPPKHYTEATLLQAMETAGKFVDDETLKAVMKENGIGRPSSRAGIIETLFKRNYIKRVKKSLEPTITGIELIDIIDYELLKSCELTGIWEKKLRDIEKGKYESTLFIKELKEQIDTIVSSVKADPSNKYVTSIATDDTKKKSSSSSASQRKQPASRRRKSSSKVIVKANQVCPLCKQGKVIKGKYSYFCSKHNEGCKFKAEL